jgi:hypothetical protein
MLGGGTCSAILHYTGTEDKEKMKMIDDDVKRRRRCRGPY